MGRKMNRALILSVEIMSKIIPTALGFSFTTTFLSLRLARTQARSLKQKREQMYGDYQQMQHEQIWVQK